MPQILVLTDRPDKDVPLADFAVSVAEALGELAVATVVTCRQGACLPLGILSGAPDGSLLPHMLPPTLLVETGTRNNLEAMFMESGRAAQLHGVAFETASSDSSLSNVIATLSRFAGLMIIGRETLIDAALPSQLLSASRVSPLVVCPNWPVKWGRLVIAVRDDNQRESLLSYGREWASRLGLPLATIELDPPPVRSVMSLVQRWFQKTRRTSHLKFVRDCLQESGLAEDDLLFVDRMPSLWRSDSQSQLLSIDDIATAAECAVAIVPGD